VAVGANDLLQDVAGGFGPDEGFGTGVVVVDVPLNGLDEFGDLVNTPRRNRWVVISRKKRSTMLSQDAEVGVKCM